MACATGMLEPGPENQYYRSHIERLLASYTHWTGKLLLNVFKDGNDARALYEAPFLLLSHGLERDPIFNYGNRFAQSMYGVTWAQLISMPSRQSAEPITQSERDRLLARVRHSGYVDDYSGVRIARNGQRFFIRDVLVWNVVDQDGQYCGQAAFVERWEMLSPATQRSGL